MEVRQFLILIQRLLCGILLLAIMCGAGGCVVWHEDPYEGRVIDADTNQPIEGVVAHGDWDHVHHSPVGVSHEYYDSRNTDRQERRVQAARFRLACILKRWCDGSHDLQGGVQPDRIDLLELVH